LFARGRERYGFHIRAEADVSKETLRLRRLRLAGLDLDRDAGEDCCRCEIPAFTKREARVGMERIGVVSLVDDPACVACRSFCRPRCLPRSVVVELGGQTRR
jgi:hypothetical protein